MGNKNGACVPARALPSGSALRVASRAGKIPPVHCRVQDMGFFPTISKETHSCRGRPSFRYGTCCPLRRCFLRQQIAFEVTSVFGNVLRQPLTGDQREFLLGLIEEH